MKIPGNKWDFDAEVVLFFCWKLYQCECLFHYEFLLGFNSFRLFTAVLVPSAILNLGNVTSGSSPNMTTAGQ